MSASAVVAASYRGGKVLDDALRAYSDAQRDHVHAQTAVNALTLAQFQARTDAEIADLKQKLAEAQRREETLSAEIQKISVTVGEHVEFLKSGISSAIINAVNTITERRLDEITGIVNKTLRETNDRINALENRVAPGAQSSAQPPVSLFSKLIDAVGPTAAYSAPSSPAAQAAQVLAVVPPSSPP